MYTIGLPYAKERPFIFDGFFSTLVLTICLVATCSFTFRMLNEHFKEHADAPSPYGVFNTLAEHISLDTIAEAASYRKVDEDSIRALTLIQSAPSLILGAHQKASFEVGFKNTSPSSWRVNGPQKITLRSYAKRESYFYDTTWESGTIVASLKKDVKPGEIVYFSFLLEAPGKTNMYQERFFLFYGDEQIPHTDVRLPIQVNTTPSNTPIISAVKNTSLTLESQQDSLQKQAALKLIQSAPSLILGVHQKASLEVGFKNTSPSSWRVNGPQKITLRSYAKRESYFYDTTWESGTIVASLKKDVKPGEIVYFSLLLEAPSIPKQYLEKMALYAAGVKIEESEFTFPILVTNTPQEKIEPSIQAPQVPSTPQLPPPPQQPLLTSVALADTPIPSQGMQSAEQAHTSLILVPPGIIYDPVDQEKTIRIGVTSTREPIKMTANKEYEIRDTQGTLYSTESIGAITTISFDFLNKVYIVITPTKTVNIPTPPRFTGTIPQSSGSPDQDTIFEILSFNNRPSWSSTLNDNTFRGLIEIRYTDATDRVWVVNELLLESYLKGIAETSNNSPYEYQKALIIAARTYAQYHINRNTKYSGEFTMKSTDADQVYRGYGAERRLPNVARAVQETRGVEVFANGGLVITPYYSQSDGRTRAWEEVWNGGAKSWLVSKEVPSDKGLPMLGHGVGMSARGALSMALDGKTFEEILKYFYTGVDLRRRYL